MSKAENKHEKESKLWMVGMVAVIVAVVLFVVAAIFIQHEQLTIEAAKATTVQKS